MSASLGVFTGAGISVDPPASLPLGDQFHERLLGDCRAAARRYGPVTDAGLRLLISGGRRNILGCIEDSLDSGTVASVLDCMRVDIPTEAHMLCAALAARGAMHVTINFDNGIELAYAFLAGETELPDQAPPAYRTALAVWRAAVPVTAPLRVVSTPEQLRRRAYGVRPLLVKLRGSAMVGADDTVVPLRPALEDLESTRLDDDRLAALAALTAHDHLLITGHSGRDLDCFESLRELLRHARFSWVVPELSPMVVRRLREIDPAQPIFGTAVEALRARLPRLPAWPRTPWAAESFPQRYETWWGVVPASAAAEAYAWMLSDAGCHGEAITLLRSLRGARDGARIRLRLANALARRGNGSDLPEASQLFGDVAGDPAAPALTRAYAMTRWAECRLHSRPVTLPRALLSAGTCSAAALVAGDGRGATRALAGLGDVARQVVDHHLESVPERRLWLIPVARAGLAAVRAAGQLAHRAGTATRQTDLELALVGMELRRCLVTGAVPPEDAAARVARAQRAYRHRGDVARLAQVRDIRCLLARVASRASNGSTVVRPRRPRPRRGAVTSRAGRRTR